MDIIVREEDVLLQEVILQVNNFLIDHEGRTLEYTIEEDDELINVCIYVTAPALKSVT